MFLSSLIKWTWHNVQYPNINGHTGRTLEKRARECVRLWIYMNNEISVSDLLNGDKRCIGCSIFTTNMIGVMCVSWGCVANVRFYISGLSYRDAKRPLVVWQCTVTIQNFSLYVTTFQMTYGIVTVITGFGLTSVAGCRRKQTSKWGEIMCCSVKKTSGRAVTRVVTVGSLVIDVS